METADDRLDELEDDPELIACKERLLALEEQIKKTVSDDAWELLLEWESEWAHYANLCISRLRDDRSEEKCDS